MYFTKNDKTLTNQSISACISLRMCKKFLRHKAKEVRLLLSVQVKLIKSGIQRKYAGYDNKYIL